MILEWIIISVYSIALILIFLYALAQLNLLVNYLSNRKKSTDCSTFDFSNPEEIPHVTIQLPVYNELYVMERLLNNISELNYPKDKLEIQVLDDSTDESFATTAAQIKKLRAILTKRKCIMKTAAEYLDKKLPIIPCGNWIKNKKTGQIEYNSKAPRCKNWEKTDFKIEDFKDQDNYGLKLKYLS